MESNKYGIDYIVCTEDLIQENRDLLSRSKGKTIICNDKELNSISGFRSPNKILMVLSQSDLGHGTAISEYSWSIYCDKIQDPGNMGSIMRIADWFGFHSVLASEDSVDFYNPKVVQSAMGAHNRLLFNMMQRDLLMDAYADICYVLALNSADMTTIDYPKAGILIVGNESRGASEMILERASHHIQIKKNGGAESLNASIACGIASFHIMNSIRS